MNFSDKLKKYESMQPKDKFAIVKKNLQEARKIIDRLMK